MYQNRYVLDALYGKIELPDYAWRVLTCPELQRLREVRLCNINSLCLTGGANINRYEHALGTAHLAYEFIRANRLSPNGRDAKVLVYSGLFHDIGSTAFGHSVQYILDSKGYEHDGLHSRIAGTSTNGGFVYQNTVAQPVFFGMPGRLRSVLPTEVLLAISDAVAGRGPMGALINSTMDLDNIDNVYRLAFHMGLVSDVRVAVALTSKLRISAGQLQINEEGRDLVEQWYHTRRRLYRYLLLNPDEFSGKCMLERALSIAQERSEAAFLWSDVDYQLLQKLAACSDDVSNIVRRLMVGDLYGCAAIFSSSNVDLHARLTDYSFRTTRVESALDTALRDDKRPIAALRRPQFAVHSIKDVNKTQRRVTMPTVEGGQIDIGKPTSRLLVGVFFTNAHLSMADVKPELLHQHGIIPHIKRALACATGTDDFEELVPYAEHNTD